MNLQTHGFVALTHFHGNVLSSPSGFLGRESIQTAALTPIRAHNPTTEYLMVLFPLGFRYEIYPSAGELAKSIFLPPRRVALTDSLRK